MPNQYTKPFNEVTGIMAQLQTAMAAARRLITLIDEPMEQEPQNPKHLPGGKTAIAFRDVSFHYLPERPLIEHFNLDVQPGQRIAIVGPTGCGKTTLIGNLSDAVRTMWWTAALPWAVWTFETCRGMSCADASAWCFRRRG